MMKFLLMLVALLSCASCATVCDKVTANVPAVNARLADVQRALNDVQDSGIRDRLSGKALERFDEAMAKAWDGYAIGVQSSALASKACEEGRNWVSIVVTAWDVIRPVLSLIGGEGTPQIADPIIWTEARS